MTWIHVITRGGATYFGAGGQVQARAHQNYPKITNTNTNFCIILHGGFNGTLDGRWTVREQNCGWTDCSDQRTKMVVTGRGRFLIFGKSGNSICSTIPIKNGLERALLVLMRVHFVSRVEWPCGIPFLAVKCTWRRRHSWCVAWNLFGDELWPCPSRV